MTNDHFDVLLDALDAGSTQFKFEVEGDMVSGRVTGVTIGTTQYGAHPIIDIVDRDGKPVTFRGFGTMLRDLAGLEVGDMVAVRFEGVGGRNGKTKLYSTAVLRNGERITLPKVTEEDLTSRQTASFASKAEAAFDDGAGPF